MRVFAGVPVPPAAAVQLDTFLHPGVVRAQRLRRVQPGNLHCTLCFFGEIPDEEVAELCEALNRTGGRSRPFTALFSGGLLFPPGKNLPRVAAVPCREGSEDLRSLHESILRESGRGREGARYRPHITVARIAKGTRRDELASLWTTSAERPVVVTVESFVLYRSVLHRSGASYDPLFTVELGR